MHGRQALRALLGLALAPFIAALVVAMAEPFFLGTRSLHIVSASRSFTSYQSPSLAYRALITGAAVTLLEALPACVVFRQTAMDAPDRPGTLPN